MITKYFLKNIQRAVTLQLLCLMVVINYILAQNSQAGWSSFNMGFAESKTSNTMVKSVAGQSFVGSSQQANTQVISGFLADTLFRSIFVAVKSIDELPNRYSLAQNYPNPFNPSTTIHFELPKESHVTMKVYNMLGQEVLVVLDEEKVAGRYDVRIDGSNLSSGVYFYSLHVGAFTETKKLLLLK